MTDTEKKELLIKGAEELADNLKCLVADVCPDQVLAELNKYIISVWTSTNGEE